MTGFNFREENKHEEHRDYFNKPGIFSNQWASITGVYRGIETDNYGVNYALFNPSLTYTPDNRAVISLRASKLMMPLVVLRPIIGTLEQWAEDINLSRDKEKADKPKREEEAKKS